MTTQQLHDNRLRIGRQISEARDAAGMRQQDLEEATGITQANISRIEKGKYSVKLDTLSTISAALGREIVIPAK